MAKKNDSITPEFAWERQPEESKEAYEAFSVYRDMGADGEKRSHAKVGRELGKSTALMNRWSASYNWVERVRLYDMHVEDLALRKATKGRAKMRERQIKIAQKLQQMGLEALENITANGTINDPYIAMILLREGLKVEDKQFAAEQEAHTPTSSENAENEALKRLDEVLKEINSAF